MLRTAAAALLRAAEYGIDLSKLRLIDFCLKILYTNDTRTYCNKLVSITIVYDYFNTNDQSGQKTSRILL